MIALYIILALILIIALIFSLYVHVIYEYCDDSFVLYARIGPFRFAIIPEKEEKLRFRKLAKWLRDKKLSTYKPKKSRKTLKEESYADMIDTLIQDLAKTAKNPEFARLMLHIAKIIVLEFRHKLHTTIDRIIIRIDEGEAADTCIRVGAVSQAVAYVIEFLNVFTQYEPPKAEKIVVYPSFDNSGYRFDIKGRFKVRIINILTAIVSSAFKSMTNDIDDNVNVQKRKDIKQ
ncbi:MAG: hypothetical protein IJF69_01760 [Clostridia bacterium]|nr:hypothetical protein [Clostridia bacterium]